MYDPVAVILKTEHLSCDKPCLRRSAASGKLELGFDLEFVDAMC